MPSGLGPRQDDREADYGPGLDGGLHDTQRFVTPEPHQILDGDVNVRQDDGQHAEDDGAGSVHSGQLPGGQAGESGRKQGIDY